VRGIVVTVLVALTVASCAVQDAYRPPSEQERADVIAAVRDYYALRDRLMTGLAIEDFWRTYPDLSDEHDLTRGINLEVMLWKWSHDPELVRNKYRVDLESYQPIRAFIRGNEATAIVHGLETYEPKYAGSTPTSGEIHLLLSLRLAGGRWTVVRTDERMMGEPAPTDPPIR
jgi:hypothetical protein